MPSSTFIGFLPSLRNSRGVLLGLSLGGGISLLVFLFLIGWLWGMLGVAGGLVAAAIFSPVLLVGLLVGFFLGSCIDFAR